MPEDNKPLVFLFDDSELDKEQIKDEISDYIDDSLSSIEIKTERIEGTGVEVEITGSSDDIDSCRSDLKDIPLSASYVLVRDEAGRELREEAYPILADIETTLREFVHRKMVQTEGFDWWKKIAPKRIRDQVEKNLSGDKPEFHPLDYANFRGLVEIITGTKRGWVDDKKITPSDLRELLKGSESISDLEEELDNKTKEISLWEEVFSFYFEDKSEWEGIEKELKDFVIEKVRHRVMHHRPIYENQLDKLKDFKKDFDEVIESAKPELEDEEYREARKNLGLISDVLAQEIAFSVAKYTQPTAEMLRQIQLPGQQVAEMMKQMQLPGQQAAEMMKQIQLPSRQVAEAIRRMQLPSQQVAEMMKQMQLPGKECPECGELGAMRKTDGKWKCGNCGYEEEVEEKESES